MSHWKDSRVFVVGWETLFNEWDDTATIGVSWQRTAASWEAVVEDVVKDV